MRVDQKKTYRDLRVLAHLKRKDHPLKNNEKPEPKLCGAAAPDIHGEYRQSGIGDDGGSSRQSENDLPDSHRVQSL